MRQRSLALKAMVFLFLAGLISASGASSSLGATPSYAPYPAESNLKPWPPEYFAQTSPVGLIAKRYNIQVGHFFTENFALSLKYTHMDNASQTLFGNDDGDEVGARASWFYALGETQKAFLGLHVGLFYLNFLRGNSFDDIFNQIFQTNSVDRDEVRSAMVEILGGPTIRVAGPMTVEFLAGLQAYRANYYTYDFAAGTRSERESAKVKIYPVIEANIGIIF